MSLARIHVTRGFSVLQASSLPSRSCHPLVVFVTEEDVREALKAEMMRSVNLLGAHGEKDWDLPTCWLPCADEGTEDEEPDSGPVGMDVSGDADSVVGSFEEDGDNAGVSNNDDSHNQDDDEAEEGGAEDGLVGGMDDVEGGRGEEEESDDEDEDIDLQKRLGTSLSSWQSLARFWWERLLTCGNLKGEKMFGFTGTHRSTPPYGVLLPVYRSQSTAILV